MKAITDKREGYGIMALVGAAIGIIVLVIAVAVGGQILDQIRDTQTIDSIAYNTTTSGLGAMDDFGDWFSTIVVIVIASFVIVLLVRQFAGVGQSM